MGNTNDQPDEGTARRDTGVRGMLDTFVRRLHWTRETVRTRPVLAFFAGTFLYSWGLFALLATFVGVETITGARQWQIPFAWGPPLAALLTVWLCGEDVRTWFMALLDPRTTARWYLFAAAVAFIYADFGSVIAVLAGVSVEFAAPPEEIISSFLISLLFAGSLEEIGWRGFAQSRLQERYDAFSASVVIGVSWGVWHLPYVALGGAGYGDGGIGAVVAIAVFGVVMSIILAWLFNGSGGSLPVVMIAHAIINAGPVLNTVGEIPTGVPGAAVGLLTWLLLIVTLLLIHGRRRLSSREPEPILTGNKPRKTSESE